MMAFLDLLVIGLIVIALSGLRVAQEYERGVIFRLGRYRGLAEQQETITRDSVTIKVNAVLWYRIVDASKSVIEVADAPAAVYQLALTGLRNIIGQHDLDEILQERNKINALLGESIAGSTAAWGLEVQRFEMKDVELPKAMQQVMAMQAEAIREKRARIIKAEAELEASVKLAAAAAHIAANPAALELRRMQMISEVGAENNSTTVLMIPSDFVSLAHSFNDYLTQKTARTGAEDKGRS
jgi:regulator of protease activity HflC (stomatin/prohibitin superfamily)